MAKPGHVYHWKHGWIPITPRAAIVKAKGNHSLAERIMRDHHIPDRRSGSDRRAPERAGDGTRGSFHYKPGTKTRDYPDRPSASSSDGGPKSASEALRMKRHELEPHAKAGNKHAQAELDRRAARRGPGANNRKPAAPAPAPKAAPAPDSRNSKPLVPVEPHQPRVESAPKPSVESADSWVSDRHAEAELNKALPHGHTVGMVGNWDRHLVNGNSIGRVEQTPNGFRAYLTDSAPTKAHPFRVKRTYVGETHDNRLDAHKALANAHIKREQDKAAKAAKAQTKAAGITGVAGPNGTTWIPHTPQGDGTRAGDEAALKAKAVFRAGGHEVTIESTMTEAQTRELLANVSRAVQRSAPNLKGANVKFLVPSGDPHFRSSRKITGAYVHVGGTTVHINPKVANGTHAEAFRDAGHAGHFMPAGKSHPLEYTLVHELGHVADNVNGHTRNPDRLTPSGFTIPMGDRDGAHALHREHYLDGSKYSRENVAEGYAEAFAQWHIGGPGSHKAADAYAEHYGWAPPTNVERPADAPSKWDVEYAGTTPPAPKAPARTPEQMRRAMDDFERQFGLGKYAKTNRQEVGGSTFKRIASPAQLSSGSRIEDPANPGHMLTVSGPAQYVPPLGGGRGAKGHYNIPVEGGRPVRVLEGSTLREHHGAAAGSPFDAEHSAGLAKADAANRGGKPLASSVRNAREALATLSPAAQQRLTGGRSLESLNRDEIAAIIRAAIAAAKRKKG